MSTPLTLVQGGRTAPRTAASSIGRWRTARGLTFKVKHVHAGRAFVAANHAITYLTVEEVTALIEAPGTVYLGK